MVIKITGTLIKNYFHCKRQAYLFHYGLNFKNELVRVGEVLHEQKKSKELIFEIFLLWLKNRHHKRSKLNMVFLKFIKMVPDEKTNPCSKLNMVFLKYEC